MKKKISVLYILIIILTFGCDDGFLDTAPYNGLSNAVIFNNDENATMAMNGVYNAMAQNAFYDWFLILTNIGPDGFSWGRAPWGYNLVTGTGTSRDNPITQLYINLHKPIVYANDVIAGLDGNEKVSETLRNRLIGEAKFVRGLCYFYLYNIYGGVVLIDKPTPVSETYLPKSTVEEVKQLVIADFTDAIDRLPVTYETSELGRPTKGSAIAMLGKVYLYNEQWSDAAEQLKKLLSTPYSYDLTDNFGDSFYWQTQNNKESVFEIQYTMETDLGSNFEQRYGNRSGGKQGEDYCEASVTALSVFTNSDGTPIDLTTIPQQEDYANEKAFGTALTNWYQTTLANADVRLHQSIILPGSTFYGKGNKDYKIYWPYAPYVNATPPALRTTWTTAALMPIRKFLTLGDENILNAKTCPTNFPIVRFADVLLMYAEAENEANGPSDAVYNAVNRVRKRAGVVDFSSGLSKDQMRREIWLERYRELMFETHLYFDVKRWKVAHTTDPIFGLNRDELDFRLKKLFTRIFNKDKDYLLPIPGSEIDLNPLLEQNPGWN
ncbi:MAG: RagB/SusD family nutrient uptake outer membrane protein [Prolixibacteraceae bacterium]